MNNALWSPRGARAGERNLATGSTLTKKNTVLAKFNTVLTKKNTAEFSVIFSYSVDSSLGRAPACNAGGPGSIPGRCSLIFGIWREDRTGTGI